MEYQRNGNEVLIHLIKGDEILYSLNQLCTKRDTIGIHKKIWND